MDKIEQAVVEIKKRLRKIKAVFAVVLYGSVARGDYSIKHSDIDILVILEDLRIKNRIDKVIEDINIEYRVRIHPEYQDIKIKPEDQTLLCKMFEEGRVLFSRGLWFMDKEELGLNTFRLYRFDTTRTSRTNRVVLAMALHGRDKHKGFIDGVSLIDAGKGGLLVRKELFNSIETLFKRLGVDYKIKKTFYA